MRKGEILESGSKTASSQVYMTLSCRRDWNDGLKRSYTHLPLPSLLPFPPPLGSWGNRGTATTRSIDFSLRKSNGLGVNPINIPSDIETTCLDSILGEASVFTVNGFPPCSAFQKYRMVWENNFTHVCSYLHMFVTLTQFKMSQIKETFNREFKRLIQLQPIYFDVRRCYSAGIL